PAPKYQSVSFLPCPRGFKEGAALSFACERSVGVLVVFELHHRLTLLEAFQSMHKGKFVSPPAFISRRP
ncbi:MAG TPA: hypothetical protein VD863_02085, partial [Bradyrhizobium sp.]|nr:hypothetical protein [Bradyrhizobium sp.]